MKINTINGNLDMYTIMHMFIWSHLEAHAGFVRLSMKGNFDVYILCSKGKVDFLILTKRALILVTLRYLYILLSGYPKKGHIYLC